MEMDMDMDMDGDLDVERASTQLVAAAEAAITIHQNSLL